MLDKMTFPHGFLLLSWHDRRVSLNLTLFSLASSNRASVLKSVRPFPRHLRRLYKTWATEISPAVAAGKNTQGSRYMTPSLCLNTDLITDIILPHVYCFATEGITKTHFLHSETP